MAGMSLSINTYTVSFLNSISFHKGPIVFQRWRLLFQIASTSITPLQIINFSYFYSKSSGIDWNFDRYLYKLVSN